MSSGAEQLWKLVETGKGSDFTIIVNDGENPPQEFKVHKLILENSSPVFEAMLQHNLKEANTGIMEITDFKPDVIKYALGSIYGCKLDEDLKIEKLLGLLLVADKYQIESLAFDCGQYILDNLISIDNCPIILTHLFIINSEALQFKLKESCFKMIQENAREMFKGGMLLKLDENILTEILDLNEFNLDGEMDLIKFVWRWAMAKDESNEGNIRGILQKNILYKIRLLTLTKKEIKETFCMDMLSSSERNILLNIIENKKEIDAEFPANFSKITEKRRFYNTFADFIFHENKIRRAIQSVKKSVLVKLSLSEWLKKTISDTTEFAFTVQVNKAKKLCGLEFFPPIKPDGIVKLKICKVMGKVDVYSGNNRIESLNFINMVEYNNSTFMVYFTPHLCLNRNEIYQIKLSIEGNSLFYCYREINQVVDLGNKRKLFLDGDIGPIRSLIIKNVC